MGYLTAQWTTGWVVLQHSGQLVGLSYSTVDNWLGCLTAQWTTGWVVSQHSGQLVGLSYSTVDNWLGCLTAQWTTGWVVFQHSGHSWMPGGTVNTLPHTPCNDYWPTDLSPLLKLVNIIASQTGRQTPVYFSSAHQWVRTWDWPFCNKLRQR